MLFLALLIISSNQTCTEGETKTVTQWSYLYSVNWLNGTRIPICNATATLIYRCTSSSRREEEKTRLKISADQRFVDDKLIRFDPIDTPLTPDAPVLPDTPTKLYWFKLSSSFVTTSSCDPFYVAGDLNSPNATIGVTTKAFTYNGEENTCSAGNDITEGILDPTGSSQWISRDEYTLADSTVPTLITLDDSSKPKADLIYFVPSCGLTSNGCVGNCTTPDPQEKATISYSVPYTGGKKYTFEFPIVHACRWDMLKTNLFKDITADKQKNSTFPKISTSKKTCNTVTSTIRILKDNSVIAESENPSTSSLAVGEYTWDVAYSMYQLGTVRKEIAPETYRLCVVERPEEYLPSFEPKAVSLNDGNYFIKPSTNMLLVPPKNPCPSFPYSSSTTLTCGDNVCLKSPCPISIPTDLTPIFCTVKQILHADIDYTKQTSFGLHFAKFAFKNVTKSGGQFKIEVTTWSGQFVHGNELYKVNDQDSFMPVDYDESTGKRYIYADYKFAGIPSKIDFKIIRPELQTMLSLTLPNSELIPAVITSVHYKAHPSNNTLDVQWDYTGGYALGETCHFKVTNAIGSNTIPDEIPNAVSPTTFTGVSESSTITVVSECTDGTNTKTGTSKSITTCFPKSPEVEVTCNNCVSSSNTILIRPEIDLTCDIIKEGHYCESGNHLTFVYDTLTLTFEEKKSSYRLTGPISNITPNLFNDQKDTDKLLKIGGFDFSSKLANIKKCIVPPAEVSDFEVSPLIPQYFRKGTSESITISFKALDYFDSKCIPGRSAKYQIRSFKESENDEIELPPIEFPASGLSETIERTYSIPKEPGIYTIHPMATGVDGSSYPYNNVTIQICDTDDGARPVITEPANGMSGATVVQLRFGWDRLDTKLRNLKCKSTDTVRFVLEIREAGAKGNGNFVTAGTLNLKNTQFIFRRVFSLNTKYEWRVNVMLETEKSTTREVSVENHYSDIHSFTTMASHCVYTPCKEGICDYATGKCECYSGYRGALCDKSGLSSAALGGIIAGILVILVAVLVVVFIFLKRRYFGGLRVPDLSQYKFAMPKAVNEDGDKAKPIDFVAGVLETDPANNFVQSLWLLERTPVTELDSVCRSLMYFFEQKGVGLAFLIRLIHYEVERSDTTETLFRNNSYASKCFKTYARMIGLPYLFRTIFPLINKLYKEDTKGEITVKGSTGNMDTLGTSANRTSTMNMTSYEINLEQNENDAEYENAIAENALLIQIACETFFKGLKSANPFIPDEFKCICREIQSSVTQRYPGYSVEVCVASFIFLRFFVAGITVPESFGIIDVRPTPTLRRRLILISKVLSNLSTNVKFGDKEDYMIVMNDYLESKQPLLKTYFAMLVSGEGRLPKSQEVPEKYYNASLSVLSYAVEKAENGEWEEEYY